MIEVDQYQRIRYLHTVEGLSQRTIITVIPRAYCFRWAGRRTANSNDLFGLYL
jgi:hypothetical protein